VNCFEEAQHQMANELHTIRFKRGGVEFELIGSEERVIEAWTKLEDAVVAAFAEDAEESSSGDPSAENGNGKDRQATKTKRRTKSFKGHQGDDALRADVAEKLSNTSIDGFAKLGSKPSARFAGYAALDWARKKADIDGLTAPEIQEFLSSRLRIKNTYQAYAAALGGQAKSGEIDKLGTRPRIFRLMNPGEEALAAHVKGLAAKAN
jgi:hypothetical protein